MKKLIVLIISLAFGFASNAQNPKNFTLKSATDSSEFNLKNAKGRYVAMHFLLKTECPYCLKHTHDYFTKANKLPNVLQIFIKPDTDAEIAEWASKLLDGDGTKNPIYRDPEAQLAKQFHIPDGYKFHGQVVHYPATILLNKKGKEVFRYVGKNNTDRYSFEQLEKKIAELEMQKHKNLTSLNQIL
jgi:peroxiredoxin Q/BCP